MRVRINSEELVRLRTMLIGQPDLEHQFNRAVIMVENQVDYNREIEDPVLKNLLETVVDTFTHVFTTGNGGYSGVYRYGCYLRVKYENGNSQDLSLVFSCQDLDLERVKVEFYNQKTQKYLVLCENSIAWFYEGVMAFLDHYCAKGRNGQTRNYSVLKFNSFFVSKSFYESKEHEDYLFLDESIK